MHRANNMVGEIVTASYNVSLVKRYFRMSKHVKPGFIKKAMLTLTTAFELRTGVVLYG